MATISSGRQRTEADLRGLLGRSGFDVHTLDATAGGFTLITAG